MGGGATGAGVSGAGGGTAGGAGGGTAGSISSVDTGNWVTETVVRAGVGTGSGAASRKDPKGRMGSVRAAPWSATDNINRPQPQPDLNVSGGDFMTIVLLH